MLTAHSRTSRENLFDLLVAQSSQRAESPEDQRRFTSTITPSDKAPAISPTSARR